MGKIENNKFKAKDRVAAIKNWYKTIPVYFVATIIMLCITYLLSTDAEVPNFIFHVLLIGPVLWWIFFFVKGIQLFCRKIDYIEKWENKKLRKILEEGTEQTIWE